MALIHKRFAHRQKPNNARGVSRLPGGTQADIMYLFDEGSGSPIDLVSNAKPLDFLGSAGWEASQKGIGVFSPAAGADHGLVQAGNRIGNGASSLAIFGQYTPLNINDALLARWGASGALSWILTHNSNGLALVVTDSSTMATAGEGRYTNPLTIGKEYTFFFSWDGTTNFRCFLNGEKVALNVWWSNGLTSISNGNSDLYLLRHGSSGASGKYNVRFAGMYVDKFVPDSVAESITREPYRHIYQPRRRWVPVVIQGGATVTRDSTLTWDLLAGLTADRSLRWDILTTAQSDSDLRWGLLNAAQKDATLPWDLRAEVIKDSDLRWDIQSALSAVTRDSTLSWALLQAASADSSLRWGLLSAAFKDSTLPWDLRQAIEQDAELRWSLLNAVQNDSDLRWSLLESALRDGTLQWDIQSALSSVSRDADLRWNLIASVQQGVTLPWDLLSSLTRDSAVRWDILTAIARDTDLRWDSLASASTDLQLQWSLVAAVQQTLEARWDLLEAVDIDADLRWQIAAQVARELAVQWSTLASAEQDLSLSWDLLAVADTAVTLSWQIQSDAVSAPLHILVIPAERRLVAVSPTSNLLSVSSER